MKASQQAQPARARSLVTKGSLTGWVSREARSPSEVAGEGHGVPAETAKA